MSIFLGALICSIIGVELLRFAGLHWSWLDRPNERSLHTRPTPRGAGLAIVVISLASYAAIGYVNPAAFSRGYIAGAIMIVAVSWLDDIYSLPFFIRLITHFFAAGLLIIDVGHLQSIGLTTEYSVGFYGLGAVVTVIWIVWVINAYNFMDGIDGIAGIQAVIAAAAWAFISRDSAGVFVLSLAVAASSLGFLAHNWHPARVFMGDVGSAFLGYTFASLPLLLAHEASAVRPELFVSAVLILWPFIFDTVLTLLSRAWSGERVWKAHRKHLYQRMVIAGHSHVFVAGLYGVFASASSAAALLLIFGSGLGPVLSTLLILVASIILAFLVLRRSLQVPTSALSSDD